MTVLIGSTIAVVATGGAAGPAVAAVVGAGETVAVGTAATVTGAVSAGVSAATATGVTAANVVGGTIIGASGAAATGGCVITGGALGAAGGASSAIGAGALGAASATATGTATATGLTILSGPVGWLVLGAKTDTNDSATYDCWRPVLRESGDVVAGKEIMHCNRNKGVPLRDVVADARVKTCEAIMTDCNRFLCGFKLINVWGELFDVTPLRLPNGKVALHAKRGR